MIDINLNIPIDTTPTNGSTNLIDSNAVFDGLATKQETLVSANNIKTINGNSVLGSGNLVVSSSGGGGVHAPLVVSGRSVTYLNTSVLSFPTAATSSLRIYAMPFIPMVSFTAASFYMNCSTLQAGALARILIYSELNGLPNTKLYESTNIDLSTNGIKTIAVSFSFSANTTYFISIHTQGTAQITFVSATSMLPIALGGTAAPTTYFYPTTTYAIGSAPTLFGGINQGSGNAPFIAITAA